MMQKSMITTVIALTLFGCGGGESGNSSTPTPPPVKKYTISFLGTDFQATTGNCQIFGYGPEKENGARDKIIAFPVEPTKDYSVIIHNHDGSVRKIFENTNLSSNKLSFAQNEIPNDGYVSFAKFNTNGISHVTTFAKVLLPDSFFVYTDQAKRPSDPCLGSSNANPVKREVAGFITPKSAGIKHQFSGFNTVYQDLNADLAENYLQDKSGEDEIEFVSQQLPLLAITYETTESGNQLLAPRSFKFIDFNQRGTKGNSIRLDDQKNVIINYDNDATLTSDLVIENALLFVNGKQQLAHANYAYLWQPLIKDGIVINDKFSYAERIGDDNYYLYLEGKQDVPNAFTYWGVTHVVQGTVNRSLDADKVFDRIPEANRPTLDKCTTDTDRQCLTIDTGSLSAAEGAQRASLSATLTIDSTRSLRQVFYTPIQSTLPILKFNNTDIDEGLEQKAASVSFMVSESPEVKEAFLYQHQNLAKPSLSDLSVDFIPLLKNIAAQQDQQDLLKRQPYTWVWLEE
ncbi:hypothetical protein [Vibrio fujianensis]|uniref:hypothetical protein n=1 Tax=Vibrio fujianensis TaxID=1974215 RepID=UPI001FEBC5E2|nr:hypothetical protein [Vibrio fujianensis]